ncbi:MAG: hypothetical protein WCB73_06345 [Pseudonocardiaceae bacterium]|jgi:hypothetical protein
MPFNSDARQTIETYVTGHLRPRDWYDSFFDFVADVELARRLGREFYTARYVYKLLEGLSAVDDLLTAQVKIQVLQYSSIYEAVVHHVLFDLLSDAPEVQSLLTYQSLKTYSVPSAMKEKIDSLVHDERAIVPAFIASSKIDKSKVRFDDKIRCASQLGLITEWLATELVTLYEARNSIHLHAEIKKDIAWKIEISGTAYWRLQPFREQVIDGLHTRDMCPCGKSRARHVLT